jgi:hypothetical protein
MSNPRASIFADDDLDVSDFAPKVGPDKSAPVAEQIRAVAEAARFHSREPAPPPAPTAAPVAKRPIQRQGIAGHRGRLLRHLRQQGLGVRGNVGARIDGAAT